MHLFGTTRANRTRSARNRARSLQRKSTSVRNRRRTAELGLDLLASLDGIRQDPKYHPEGDALFHSLQSFGLARKESTDPVLWAAALLHDVGKALGSPDHDVTGSDLLDGLVAPRIVWLVAHHLDLLRAPALTRRRLRGTSILTDLEHLRRWDVGGRDPHAIVMAPEEAMNVLVKHTRELSTVGAPAPEIHAPEDHT
jgi:hypothetical protein